MKSCRHGSRASASGHITMRKISDLYDFNHGMVAEMLISVLIFTHRVS